MQPNVLTPENILAVSPDARLVEYSGKWLRATRECAGMTAAEFARAVSAVSGRTCRSQHVWAWERTSFAIPGPSYFDAILEVLTRELEEQGVDTRFWFVSRTPAATATHERRRR